MRMRKMKASTQLLNTISHVERKTTHSFIVKDEERNDLECEQWDVKSSLAQHDASSAEESIIFYLFLY